MKNISIIGLEARNKAIAGLNYVATAIKSTIGPHGLNFLIEKGNSITNDGYLISVALCPTIKDEFERRGALTAQEASSKTNDMVGDATSTAWALTDAIVKEAVKYLPSDKVIKAKKTSAEIVKMIQESKERVDRELEKMTKPIKDKKSLIKSALVSVEDEAIAELLGSAQWELGPEGIILAEEVNEPISSIEKVKGIRLDNGFGTSHVITNPERQSLELHEVSVMLTNYVFDTKEIQLLRPVFEKLAGEKKNVLVLVARAFTSEAIKFCMESMKTGFAIFPVNAPYTDQTEIMHDLETVLGGHHIDVEERRLEDTDTKDIGFAKRFVARRFDAVVTGVEDEQSETSVAIRVKELKKKLEGSQSEFEKKAIETRIAQLTNGFALLKVGSTSLINRKRLKDKCDDAVNAVRLALKGGTVKGGGLAFKEISDKMEDGDILKRPLTCVYDQIMSTAPEGWTIPEWVRDPYIVLKTALDNACETAGVFSSINGLITSKDEKPRKQEDDE